MKKVQGLVYVFTEDSLPLPDQHREKEGRESYCLISKAKDVDSLLFASAMALVAVRYNYNDIATLSLKGKEGQVEIPVDLKCTLADLKESLKPLFQLQDGEKKDSPIEVSYQDNQICIAYEMASYTKEFIENLAQSINAVLCQPEKTVLGNISLVTREEISVLDSFNDTEMPYDKTIGVLDLFAQQVKNNPKKIAVVYRDHKYTFEEVDSLSSDLAHYLLDKGVKKGDYVSLLLSRSEYMVICALGVLKSGAAYQPLDPSYPPERLNFMVQDSSASYLIADRDLLPLVNEYHGPSLVMEDILSLPHSKKALPHRKGEDKFIILYTSGTTGTPKGCELKEKNIMAFLAWYIPQMKFTKDSRSISYASFGFDACIMDLYSALCSGTTLYIIPSDMRLDLATLNRYFKDNKITHAFFTTQMARQFALLCDSPYLKRLAGGGEKLVPFNPPKNIEFENCYGPSETTIYCTGYTIKDDNPILPIGKAKPNVKTYILGKDASRLPLGALGELYISGPQVSEGYLNRPEKTAEAFLQNPFAKGEYATYYKTGDVVRYLPSGDIQYVGRRDAQVKIRGFRIELTEVEKVIREAGGVKDATVQAFDSPNGSGKFLAAYLVGDQKLDFEAIKAFILERKPPYMVPAFFMQLDAIPYNVNGKVDKKKLPVAKHEEKEARLPETEKQKALYQIVKETLGAEEFSIDTDFLSLGLSSISGAALCLSIAEHLNVNLKISDLSTYDTVEKLASYLEGKKETKTHKKQADYPLTKSVEGVFLDTLQNEEEHIYNISLLLKLDPSLSVSKLKVAIAKVIDAHPYLKTRFFYDAKGNIRQKRNDDELYLPSDVKVIKTADIEDIKPVLEEPLDIVNGKLFLAKIIQDKHNLYLYFQIHHTISDGTSFAVLFEDISSAYLGKEIEKENYTSFDLALDEEEERKSEALQHDKEYYASLFATAEPQAVLEATVRDPREESMAHVDWVSEEADISKIKDYVDKIGATMNAYFVTAFGYTEAMFNYSSEAIFTTVYNGRDDSRTNRIMGMLVKSLPVYLRYAKEDKIADKVLAMKEQLLQSQSHTLYSFSEISKEFDIKPDMIFAYQGETFNFDSLCGKPSSEIRIPTKEIMNNFSIQCFLEGNKLRYQIDYKQNVFDASFIKEFMHVFEHTLNELFCKETFQDIVNVDEEQKEFIDECNATESKIDEKATVASLFETAAKKYPNHTAVSFKETSYTYQEVDRYSLGLARYLASKGIGKEDVVSILIGRNPMYPICTLGVLRSGAAYQPLDPTYPKERLNFMVKDGNPKLLLCEKNLLSYVDEYKGEVLFIEDIMALASQNQDQQVEGPEPSSKFILLYTSGSTGTPKGVVLEHHGLVNFIAWYTKEYEMDSHSVSACYASFGFDANMMDMYPTLSVGGEVTIVDEDMRLDLMGLDKYYQEKHVTNSFMTTQMGRQFATVTTSDDLHYLCVGGEKLVPVKPPKKTQFYNGYGPTECTIFSTTYHVESDSSYLPIGKPLANYKLFVLDKNQHLLPPYALGELYISGYGVGRGYLNRPEKTAEAFLPNHLFKKKGYETLYRSGDVVRLNRDGNIEFIGRRDSQVKIRGFRIELTEVEGVIREYPLVADATVQALDAPNGGKMVVAYVVAKDGFHVDSLNHFIREKKPPYMVPSYTVVLDKIPLNANGKVDKRKLPLPTISETKAGKEPNTETEKKLCAIFAEALGLKKVYANDDFFSIGGSSIIASKVMMLAQSKGLSLVYKNIFDHSTPEQLAQLVDQKEVKPIQKKEEGNQSKDGKEPFADILSHSTVENLDKMKEEYEIKDVLITGVTGFLGAHILKELLSQAKGTITCLVRKGKSEDAKSRLQALLVYYFSDPFDEDFSSGRLRIVDSDITSKNLSSELKDCQFDLIINSAAIVKHFSNDDSLNQVNTIGVKNLIEIALEHKARLVQISTCSIGGENVNHQFADSFSLKENMFSFGQALDNKYIHTKYMAEEAIFEAMETRGLKAKIMRMGNLMARASDGEFQINSSTNGFMRSVRGYKILGAFPVSAMDTPVEFSPIDLSAKAVVTLAKTGDFFTVFHPCSSHTVHMANIIECLQAMGFVIDVVSDEEFANRMKEAMKDQKRSFGIAGLLSYQNDAGEIRSEVPYTNAFTTKALYRLGFSWNLTDKAYIEQTLSLLDSFGFFEENYAAN